MIYVHFSLSLSSKLTLVANHNAYATMNHFLIIFTITSRFYHGATKNSCINNQWLIWRQVANVWFGMDKIPCSVTMGL
jgi:hypothetical protein